MQPEVADRLAERHDRQRIGQGPEVRLRKVADSKAAAREEGIAIARETLSKMMGSISGAQISAPFGRIQSAIDVLQGIK